MSYMWATCHICVRACGGGEAIDLIVRADESVGIRGQAVHLQEGSQVAVVDVLLLKRADCNAALGRASVLDVVRRPHVPGGRAGRTL